MDTNLKTAGAATAYNRQKEEEETKKSAFRLGYEYDNLSGYPVSLDVVKLFLDTEIKDLPAIPFMKVNQKVKVAISSPLLDQAKSAIADFAKKNGLEVSFVYVSPSSFNYLKNQQQQAPKSNQTINYNQVLGKDAKKALSLPQLSQLTKETNTTDLLEVILTSASSIGASDIHIEPREKEALVRFRIDGVLHDATLLSVDQFKGLISRIKVLAKLKIDTLLGPQDGRFGFSIYGKQVDLRISTLPSIYGEGVVIRLLEQEDRFKSLADLGFRPEIEKLVREAVSKPHGMILATGPTGSGKTTTMYAILKELNSPEKKIITLEDPVEYRISGLVQSQVSENLDFAQGLKAILRQDPDVILVGEIRDTDTANISINAALTGHLLLSTLHTNNAPAALARLLDLGAAPFLLAGSINLIIAQRLVRKLCANCKKPVPISEELKAEVKSLLPNYKLPESVFEPTGCVECANTGYKGRIVIAEAFVPSQEIEKLVLKKSALREIETEAYREGMVSMKTDGLIKVLTGITSAAEVRRVTTEY